MGASDLWDLIIDKYCNSEEKKKLMDLPEEEYKKLEYDYVTLLHKIRFRIVDASSPTKENKDGK